MNFKVSSSAIKEIYHQVFLPPNCPDGEIGDSSWELACLELILSALHGFICHTNEKSRSLIENSISAIETLKKSMDEYGTILQGNLQTILASYSVVCLHIRGQNAGLIIRPTQNDMIVEAFELSAPNAAVYSTTGRLQRFFPSNAVAVPKGTFHEPDFLSQLTRMISKMSHQPFEEMLPRSKKAGKKQVEERDITEARLVTDFLMAILQGVGGRCIDTQGISKNTREEVNWAHGHKLPWRRSPVWLLCRVALQLTMARDEANKQDDGLYKRFMVYFMSCVAQEVLTHAPSPEHLFVINAKIARRLTKLKVDAPEEPWMDHVHRIMKKAKDVIEQNWESTISQVEGRSEMTGVHILDAKACARTEPKKLKEFIDIIPQRMSPPQADFVPPAPALRQLRGDTLPSMDGVQASRDYDIYNLMVVEEWVAQHLSSWISAHEGEQGACSQLQLLIKQYHASASEIYKSLPEGKSAMFLTILDLWVACDTSAVKITPLLGNYKPDITLPIWGALLLHSKRDMERLQRAELYLKGRHDASVYRESAVIEFGTKNSFPTQYAASSTYHDDLRLQILQEAEDDRQRKKEELQRLKEKYRQLMSESEMLAHEFRDVTDSWGDVVQEHREANCRKCRLSQQAEDLHIEPHEWPLPENLEAAQSVVFELHVPRSFQAWRDCTVFLLKDVLGFEQYKSNPKYSLRLTDYTKLFRFFRSADTTCRVGILSEAKPQDRTHYKKKTVAVTSESDVCLKSAPIWKRYDVSTGTFLENLSPTHLISEMCTFTLPTRSNGVLQDFLWKPWTVPDGCEPNSVLARQSECPTDSSLSEFRADCSLGLGCNIQWINILRQLAMPSMDWSKYETVLHVWQLANQAGPSSSDFRRQCHQHLGDPTFVEACVREMNKGLGRIRKSWESCPTVGAYCIVATRLASLCPDESIDHCLKFLEDCRKVSFEWQLDLRSRAFNSQSAAASDLSQKALEAASVCIMTFNLPDGLLADLLNDQSNLKLLLGALITLQENTTAFEKSAGIQAQALLVCRWLMQRCHERLMSLLTNQNSSSLDEAIKSTWDTFDRAKGEKWEAVNRAWLRSRLKLGASSAIPVHFNVITGELLIAGLPRRQLPTEYVRHDLYPTLFGKLHIEAVPSVEEGMDLSSVSRVFGHKLHFALSSRSAVQFGVPSPDFLVRARKGDITWELVPSRVFEDLLPRRLVTCFVHWYNVNNSTVEFRPKERIWDNDSFQWQMYSDGQKWMIRDREGAHLIFPGTTCASRFEKTFAPIEDMFGLHIILTDSPSRVDVHIPRFQLDFFLTSDDNCIKSRQYKGMSVDRNQAIGTLIGLRSKLVLCKDEPSGESRVVLIPETPPTIARGPHHVVVTMGMSTPNHHAYTMNAYLRRLEGNRSTRSRLFLAELHAITSGLCPDPFTEQTGKDMAFDILTSAALKSTDHFTQDEADIMSRIADLSPSRYFYPAHLCEMQVTEWNQFCSPLLQSDKFRMAVEELFETVQRVAFLYQQPLPEFRLPEVEPSLVRRACRRLQMLDTYSFTTNGASSDCDIAYKGRKTSASRTSRTIQVCKLLTGPSAALLEDPQVSFSAQNLYGLLSCPKGIPGLPFSTSPAAPLEYDTEWFGATRMLAKKYWCYLHHELGKQQHGHTKPSLMIWLATMAFSDKVNMLALHACIGIAFLPILKAVKPPVQSRFFYLTEGIKYSDGEINSAISSSRQPFNQSTESRISRQQGESNKQLHDRRHRTFQSNLNAEERKFRQAIAAQWRCREPSMPLLGSSYIKGREAMDIIAGKFQVWYDNWTFHEYLERVCAELRRAEKVAIDGTLEFPAFAVRHVDHQPGNFSMAELLGCMSPPEALQGTSRHNFSELVLPENLWGSHHSRLLLESLRRQAHSDQEHKYLDMLDESIGSLAGSVRLRKLKFSDAQVRVLLAEIAQNAQKDYAERLRILSDTLTVESKAEINSRRPLAVWKMIRLAPQWPRISPRQLLLQLNQDHWKHLPAMWKWSVVDFALSLSNVQTLDRLLSPTSDLVKELSNLAPRNWDPMRYPDSLLLEVESNIRIRPVQEDIAGIMRDPPQGQNAVMQLNMGEGKSSVIVPIIAVSLANGSQLVRVIVAKPQSKQMQDMLVSKLGGLLGRRVYYMPISRSCRMSSFQAQSLANHCRDCVAKGGVMLVQPEHILSFQLMVVETGQMAKDASAHAAFLETQKFLFKSARDIVDESDENFSTKFELIYTMGSQRLIEHGWERWTIIQEMMSLVVKYATDLRQEIPQEIEMDTGSRGSFPRTRFLSERASQMMLGMLAGHLFTFGMRGLPISRQAPDMRDAVRIYISEPNPSPTVVQMVEDSDLWRTASQSLLLVRGLLAGGILAFAFGQKRWRVNYGLDFTRVPETRLAIPYRAKDNPSPRSEFSHPDVVIALTCLAYYYGGLELETFRQTFSHLVKSDEADIEYQAWVKTSNDLPNAFRDIKGINFRDEEQFDNDVFPCFRLSKSAIDYYLAHVVFPKEMKEFPHKLSASGWDLGRADGLPVTGFSGTNDSRHVLPLDVEQLDLPDQKHTNAMVLEILSGPENLVVSLVDNGITGACDTHQLLRLLVELSPEIRVILDVGAQILELTNEQLAHEWLNLVKDKERSQAVVFCNDDDELCALDRRGHVEPLSVSPFAKQLDVCLVFLDEAHTRGIDLKLPRDYRAAVTLGANLTKDRLVQACNRLRELGKGQAVTFCIPEEIETKIRQSFETDQGRNLSVSDVLTWSIRETWKDIRRSIPLWAMQGRNFARQRELWGKVASQDASQMAQDTAREFLEDEAQSLEARYRPSIDFSNNIYEAMDNKIIRGIQERCHQFSELDDSPATLQQEQERELAPEIEQERELERAPPAQPLRHCLHPNVVHFVRTGEIKAKSSDWGFTWAFQSLIATSAFKEIDVGRIPHGLLVTQDFARTVTTSFIDDFMDAFQREVQWVLTNRPASGEVSTMMLLSPYEANRLLPDIQRSKLVVLHTFAPRQNSIFEPLDDLRLYRIPNGASRLQIPDSLRIELAVFSGQLYFKSYQEYTEVCKFLCLSYKAEESWVKVYSDGFIDPACHEAGRPESTIFQESPVKFLRNLLENIRRHGDGISRTHMGRVLDGELLLEHHIDS
ncbi:hypothetical protein B0I35DRAFT_379484 [Stachybotrys elegans]|uniref:ubiquitinyl hydrolase 1 n=1 Tax=Stachybotrys elegans TaxID=80388 RepID=A0A8K0WMR4_9HYPO|nr:hypothetical protein B0I35DRAFT_379484 [Stachybotrys elegans]